MRWTSAVGWAVAAATVGIDPVAAQTTVWTDRDTGFTFSSYAAKYTTAGQSIYFRIAVPSDAENNSPFDVVVQIAAPREVGWAGLAWGGSMTWNPLTVAWANGNSVVISSRFAQQHTAPSQYRDATFEVLRTGTRVNGTYWQVTAKCTGCTSWRSRTNNMLYLRPRSGTRLAFAYAKQAPGSSSESATITYHDVHNYWTHDFSVGVNSEFDSLVTRNGGRPRAETTAVTGEGQGDGAEDWWATTADAS